MSHKSLAEGFNLVTLTASAVTSQSAVLNAEVTTAATAALVHFELSASGRFDDTIASENQSVPAGAVSQKVSASYSQLAGVSTYAFRIAANDGSSPGATLTFNTGFANSIKSVAETTATILRSYAPWSSELRGTRYNFTAYDTKADFTTAKSTPKYAMENVFPVTVLEDALPDLLPCTLYYYQLHTDYVDNFSSHANYSTASDALAFVTAGVRSIGDAVALTLPALEITSSTALLAGKLNGCGEAQTVRFEYATSADFSDVRSVAGSAIAAGTAWNSIRVLASNLPAGRQVYYRIVAEGTRGTIKGLVQSFVTGDGPPTVSVSSAAHIGASQAVLRALVATGNKPTNARLEYSISPLLTGAASISLPALEAGLTLRNVDALLPNLAPSTTYYARFIATNSAGEAAGAISSFQTLPSAAPALTLIAPTGLYGYTDATFRAAAAGGTLQASVNPNGFPTVVEFFLNGVSLGSVNAGDGTTARIVRRTFGFPISSQEAAANRTTAKLITAVARNVQAVESDTIGVLLPELSLLAPSRLYFQPTLGVSATDVGSTSVLLTARPSINPNQYAADAGPITVEFFLNGANAGTMNAGAGSAPKEVTLLVNALLPSTPYTLTATVSDDYGASVATPQEFTTLSAAAPLVPFVTTLSPDAVGVGSATLRASSNPRGFATSVEFFVNGVSRGSVPAGSGSISTTVELTVSGLAPQTSYTVTTVASNSAGTSPGGAIQFTTSAAAKPVEVTTLEVFETRSNSATLRANVNPHGQPTSVEFFINGVSKGSVPAGSAPGIVELPVSGLNPQTSYTVTTVASNALGTALGGAVQFTTTPAIPVIQIQTLAVANLTSSAVTLRAKVTAPGQPTNVEFFINGVSKGSVLDGFTSLPATVELPVSGLSPQTTYTVTTIASNSAGTAPGGAVQFTTAATSAVEVTTLSVEGITASWATLRASVNPHGQPTSVEFFLNGISKGSASAGSGLVPVIVDLRLSGLASKTSYTVTTSATNASGSATGGAIQFATDSPAPGVEVTTYPSTEVTRTSAKLRALVNPHGQAASVEFFLNGISKGSVQVGSGEVAIFVELPVSGLSPHTTYTVSTSASNTWATAPGGIIEFTTPAAPPTPGVATITMLAPEIVTPVSATLRASVNPKGVQTDVEFFVDGVSVGIVNAGHGVLPIIVKMAAEGLAQQTIYAASARALSSLGTNLSAPIQLVTASDGMAVQAGRSQFDLTVRDSLEIPRAVGRLTLSTTGPKGAFSGTLNFDGLLHRFRGVLNSAGGAVIRMPSIVLGKSLTIGGDVTTSLVLTQDANGGMRLRAKIEAGNSEGSYFWAEGLALSDPAPGEGIAGSRYTIILPMRDPAPLKTPHGDGFLAGQISSKGAARFAGRTGSGKPFTITGRLQSNRALSIGQTTSGPYSEFTGGELRFAPGDLGLVTGDLTWRTVSYNGFTKNIVPTGGNYIQPGNRDSILPHAGSAATSVIRLTDYFNELVITRTLNQGRDNSSLPGSAAPGRLSIQVDRAHGLFSGRVAMPGSSKDTLFSGVIVQALNRGSGQANFGGVFGAVELSAQ